MAAFVLLSLSYQSTISNMLNVLIDPSNERKIVDFRTLGLRDVMALGRYRYARAHRPLARHSHGDMIEICYLDEGVQPYVIGRQAYVLKGGEVLVTFPREMHGTGGNPENRGRLYWLLLRVPGPRERFLNLAPEEARPLVRDLLALSPRQFRVPRVLKYYLERIFEVHDRPGAFRAVEIRNWTLRFLLDVAAASRRHEAGRISPAIRAVLARIEERLGDPTPPLESLADSAHLSLAWFKARFRKEVGLAPGSYIALRKIERARVLLARPAASITRIAMDLGFSTSQYFATVFRRYTGMTPRAYREQALREKRPGPPGRGAPLRLDARRL